MKVAITGANGLIGAALVRSLRAGGHDVVRLVRRPARSADEARWDPRGGRVDTGALEGVDAVVHLAGEPLGPRRWTAARRREIRDSRVAGTDTLCRALAAMERPPQRLLCGTAVGFYGDTGHAAVDERTSQGSGFLAGLVGDWEAATEPAQQAGISVAHMRTGVVLSTSGGLFATVLPLFRLGLGGRLGPGTQYMSWISLTDHVRAVEFLLQHPEVGGPVNLCAPEPVTNADYTRAIAARLRRPAAFAVPSPVMRAALGGFADEAALVSQRVMPGRLRQEGFEFRHPTLPEALEALLPG